MRTAPNGARGYVRTVKPYTSEEHDQALATNPNASAQELVQLLYAPSAARRYALSNFGLPTADAWAVAVQNDDAVLATELIVARRIEVDAIVAVLDSLHTQDRSDEAMYVVNALIEADCQWPKPVWDAVLAFVVPQRLQTQMARRSDLVADHALALLTPPVGKSGRRRKPNRGCVEAFAMWIHEPDVLRKASEILLSAADCERACGWLHRALNALEMQDQPGQWRTRRPLDPGALTLSRAYVMTTAARAIDMAATSADKVVLARAITQGGVGPELCADVWEQVADPELGWLVGVHFREQWRHIIYEPISEATAERLLDLGDRFQVTTPAQLLAKLDHLPAKLRARAEATAAATVTLPTPGDMQLDSFRLRHDPIFEAVSKDRQPDGTVSLLRCLGEQAEQQRKTYDKDARRFYGMIADAMRAQTLEGAAIVDARPTRSTSVSTHALSDLLS